MLFQIIDVDYVFADNKPVVRIFCRTENGGSACLLYDKFSPYFYIKPKSNTERLNEIKEIKKIESVKKFLPFGYNDEKEDLLKITVFNPQDVPAIKDMLLKERIAQETFESDILFKYRFMVDFCITGMSWIDADVTKVSTKTVKTNTYLLNEIKDQGNKIDNNMRILSLDIECLPTDPKKPLDPKNNTIIMISLVFTHPFRNKSSLVLLAKPATGKDVRGFSSEKEMLEEFKNIVDTYDPDIITGYNINAFDMPYLLERMRKHSIPQSIGRANDKNAFTKSMGMFQYSAVPGRIVVDPYQILKRDPWVKLHRYDLKTVAREMLKEEKGDVEYGEMERLWNSSGEELERFIEYSRKDSQLNMNLIIKRGMLDKFFEICKITGVLMQDTFGGQTQRIETMLLHDFKKKDFVMPTKTFRPEKDREVQDLKGATVLEPAKGLHSDGCILVLDFKSLYPSIMRTYNISPDTLILTKKVDKYNEAPNKVLFVQESVRQGIFPELLQKLVEARIDAKKKMKDSDPDTKRVLNARQLALKDISNSFYGYTGYARARLFMLDVANAITAYGRKNIEKTKNLIEEKFDAQIVYGDTDSVFVKTKTTNLDEAKAIGEKISEYVTKELGGYLELEFEKTYRTFLILTKKRYVGWSFRKEGDEWKDSIEMKGIETVRRDWCPLVSKTMREVIDIILKEGDVQKAMKSVRKVIEELREGKIDIEKLTVIKGITRNLESYDGTLPHIELAKKIAARNPSQAPKVGDRIGFVIIKGNQPLLSKRAEDPAYIKNNNLEIDSEYYIKQQILPPIERIFISLNVSRNELIGLGRQMSLGDIVNGTKREMKHQIPISYDKTEQLTGWEDFICMKCHKTLKSMPLRGCCTCGGELKISCNGSIGDKVKLISK